MVQQISREVNKTKLAQELGVSRSSLYYRHKRDDIDQEVKKQIESVLVDHPSYGHKRIALHLKLNKKRIQRVMKKYGLKPYRRRTKKPVKKDDQGKPPTHISNLIQDIQITHPEHVWCTDFTYIFLVLGALEDALKIHTPPTIIHSDQGSEYTSEDFILFVTMIEAKLSMSTKGSPWQNGHQESFYSHFKLESGDLNRFETLGELIEYIYQQIYYYNNKRIHSTLKMTPVEKRKRLSV